MFNFLCKNFNSTAKNVVDFIRKNGISFVVTTCQEGYKQFLNVSQKLLNTDFDLLYLFDDRAEMKHIVETLFNLKSVASKVLCKNADNYYKHSISNSQEYNQIEAISLPQGFQPLLTTSYCFSFFGVVEGKKIICIYDDPSESNNIFNQLDKSREAFNNIFGVKPVDDGLNDNYNLCLKLFGLTQKEVYVKMIDLLPEDCFSVRDDGYMDCALFITFPSSFKPTFLDKISKSIYSIFGDYIYADFDENLSFVLSHIAKLAKIKIATAESLTAGLIVSSIVDTEGASDFLDLSFVTYSDRAKQDLLGVRQDTLITYSAVSEQVAKEMSEGLRLKYNVDVAISATGIAGPTGQSIDKPVGLVYVGISTASHTEVTKNIFKGDRQTIRKTVANFAMFSLIKTIKNI